MKFTIRDLFLVTVIVALVFGWWVDHRRQAISKREIDFFRTGFLEQQNELHHYYKVGTPDSYFRPNLPASSLSAPNPPSRDP